MTATPNKRTAALRRHGDEEHADHPAHTKSTNNAAVAESDGPQPKRLRRTTATSSAAPAGGFVDLSIDLPVKKVGGTIELLDDSDDDDDGTAHVKAAGPDAPSAKDGGRAEEDSNDELCIDSEDNDSSSDFEEDDASSAKKKAPTAGRGPSLKSSHSANTGMDASSLAVADEGGRANGVPSASNSNLIVIDSDDDDVPASTNTTTPTAAASSARRKSTGTALESSGTSRAGPSAGGTEDHLARHLRRLQELLPYESKEDLLEMAKQDLQEDLRITRGAVAAAAAAEREEKARSKQGDEQDDAKDAADYVDWEDDEKDADYVDDEEDIDEEKVERMLSALQEKGTAFAKITAKFTSKITSKIKSWRSKTKKLKGKERFEYIEVPFDERANIVSRILAEVKQQQQGRKKVSSAYTVPKVTYVVPKELLSEAEQSRLASVRGERGVVARGGLRLEILADIGLHMDPPIKEEVGLKALRCIGLENLHRWRINCAEGGLFDCLECGAEAISARQSSGFTSTQLRNHERSCRHSHDEPTCSKCGQTPSELGYTGDRKTQNFNLHEASCTTQDDWDLYLGELTIYFLDHPGDLSKIGWGTYHAGTYCVGVVKRNNQYLYSKTKRVCGHAQKEGSLPAEGERAQQLWDYFGLKVTPYNPEIFRANVKARKSKKKN